MSDWKPDALSFAPVFEEFPEGQETEKLAERQTRLLAMRRPKVSETV